MKGGDTVTEKEVPSSPNRIKQLRLEQHKTQKEVGKAVGLSDRAIAHYEKGIREPKLETWLKLADFFNVPAPYLQGLSDVKETTPKERLYKYLDTLGDGQSLDINNLDLDIYLHDDWLKKYFEFSKIYLDKERDAPLIDMQNSIKNRKAFEHFSVILRELLEVFLNAVTNHDKFSHEFYNELNGLVRNYYEITHSEKIDKNKKINSHYVVTAIKAPNKKTNSKRNKKSN